MGFKTVLVPVDGSRVAETAVPYGERLAKLMDAELVLVRVVETERPIYDAKRREIVWIDRAHPRTELLEPDLLEPLVQRLEASGARPRTVVRLGDARDEIVREAEERDDPVIVLASHGRGGVRGMLLGSVARAILQTAPCPVLVARARDPEHQPREVTFGRLAVLLDGSELAEQALPVALTLADAAGASIELVRVAETYRDEMPDEPEPIFTPASYRAALKQFEAMEEEAGRYLEGIAERLRQQGMTVTTRVLSGNPFSQISEYASRERPDLIVMTSHGRGGISRWVLGSVADKLMTSSDAPLLLLRSRSPTGH